VRDLIYFDSLAFGEHYNIVRFKCSIGYLCIRTGVANVFVVRAF